MLQGLQRWCICYTDCLVKFFRSSSLFDVKRFRDRFLFAVIEYGNEIFFQME